MSVPRQLDVYHSVITLYAGRMRNFVDRSQRLQLFGTLEAVTIER